jgi:hypothetical protein
MNHLRAGRRLTLFLLTVALLLSYHLTPVLTAYLLGMGGTWLFLRGSKGRRV